MNDKIEKLQKIIDSSSNIVFFGGAGVSVESGIPDFRSADGIYSNHQTLSPEDILSHSFFYNHPKEFYEFYKSKMIYQNAMPNSFHYFLVELEKKGKLKAIITQNIDSLHQEAGSKNVIELHGSVKRNYCTKCHHFYDLDFIINTPGVPYCKKCQSIVKPDVVLYQEPLDLKMQREAYEHLITADCLIVGGTSLTVEPARSMIYLFKGKYSVLVNKSPTSFDEEATLVINDSLGKIFEKIKI